MSLGLNYPASGDPVSPEPFNDNFEKIDEAISRKYVIESGTTSGWNWEKYSDGTMRQWIDSKSFSNVSFSAWGSGFYTSSNLTFPNYPIAFYNSPLVNINITEASNSAWYFVSYESSGTKAKPPRFCIVALRGSDKIISPIISIEAKGRWK